MKRGSGFSRYMKANPATPRPFPNSSLWDRKGFRIAEEALKRICPGATRYGQDQYRCGQCGVIWSIDENRPACESTGLEEPT